MDSNKIRDGFLYFTNTQAGYFCRIPIDKDGVSAGPLQILQIGLITADDFIFDQARDAYIAQDAANVLTEVSAAGGARTLVSGLDDTHLAGATAVAFGRTALDASVLYVSTNGG